MYLFGKKALNDNLNNKNIVKVYTYKPDNALLSLLRKHHIPYEILNNNGFFNKFDSKLNHQNIAIRLNDKKTNSLKEFLESNTKGQSLILMLDSIEDPQNFGAILRSADAFKVDAVIYKKNNQAQVNELVAKTSMGAVANLNLFKVTNLVNEIELLKKYGYWIYASNLSDKSELLSNIKFDKKSVIIIGNENSGVSNIVLKNSDFQVKIRMYGNVQSLNVSVATGILLNEFRKQIN